LNGYVPSAFLLYDDGCHVCKAAKDLVSRFDRDQEFAYLGLASPTARKLAAGLDETAYWSSFHLVSGKGKVTSGADAFEEILGILPAAKAVRRAMDEVPPVRSGARALYEFAVKLRGDLRCEHRVPSSH